METINIPFYDDMLLAGPFTWEIIGILFGITFLLSGIVLFADSIGGPFQSPNRLKRQGIIIIIIGLLLLSITGRMFYKDYKDIDEFKVISSGSVEVIKIEHFYRILSSHDYYWITYVKDNVVVQSTFIGGITVSDSNNAIQATVLKVENKYGCVIDDYIYELIVCPKAKYFPSLSSRSISCCFYFQYPGGAFIVSRKNLSRHICRAWRLFLWCIKSTSGIRRERV